MDDLRYDQTKDKPKTHQCFAHAARHSLSTPHLFVSAINKTIAMAVDKYLIWKMSIRSKKFSKSQNIPD